MTAPTPEAHDPECEGVLIPGEDRYTDCACRIRMDLAAAKRSDDLLAMMADPWVCRLT